MRMLTEEKTCAFSGHREIPDRIVGGLIDLIDRAIAYCYRNSVRTFFCGGAIGFDTIAAERVLRAKETYPDIRLSLVLPCEDQDKFWSPSEKARYRAILAAADAVCYISETYSKGCLKERNERLAFACDYLVCYVDHAPSGAAQTRRMAEKLGRTVFNLARSLSQPRGENQEE